MPREDQIAKVTQTSSWKKHARLNSFLSKTYHMAGESDPSIISWSDGGESFTIHDIPAFENTILPSYFKHSKFSSFIRQLNFYGFKKLRMDPFKRVESNSVRFSHPYFRQNDADLLFKIKRTTGSAPQKSNHHEESDETEKDNEIESLRQELSKLKEEMAASKLQMEQQMKEMAQQVQSYQDEISFVSKSYKTALLAAALRVGPQPTANHSNASLPPPPRHHNMFGSYMQSHPLL